MIWYDADEFWPGKDAKHIVIDGTAYLHLLPQYIGSVHSPDSLGGRPDFFLINAHFYCLFEHSLFLNQDEDEIDIEHALFYMIKGYCCNIEGAVQKHGDYCRSIGLYYDNIRNFIDKDDLKSCSISVTRWGFLGEDK